MHGRPSQALGSLASLQAIGVVHGFLMLPIGIQLRGGTSPGEDSHPGTVEGGIAVHGHVLLPSGLV
eukprot:5372410-Prorocentrum_lima.AAC.1